MLTTAVLRSWRLFVIAAATFVSVSSASAGIVATSAGSGDGPVTVPGDEMRQRLTYLAPVYPSPATPPTYGTVVLNIVVDCSGKVISDTVASGSDPLASASVAAVNTWTYKPYLVNGTPVKVQTTVTLTFGAGKGKS